MGFLCIYFPVSIVISSDFTCFVFTIKKKREIHQYLTLISCIGNTSDSWVDFSTRQYGSQFMLAIKAGLEMTIRSKFLKRIRENHNAKKPAIIQVAYFTGYEFQKNDR